MKIVSILELSSLTSSQTMKMIAPSLRAMEIAYLAFKDLSSSEASGSWLTKSQSIISGSIEAQRLIRKTPFLRLASLKPLICLSSLPLIELPRYEALVLMTKLSRRSLTLHCEIKSHETYTITANSLKFTNLKYHRIAHNSF